MASLPGPESEGFATPAALVFGLALALIATALLQRSTMLLHLSRADLARLQVEYALDGAHLAATAAIVRTGAGGPYRWSLASDVGGAEVVAEPEADKLSLSHASEMGDQALASFGVIDGEALRARLSREATSSGIVDVAALDDAPLWRACAMTMISSLGAQSHFIRRPWAEPHIGGEAPAWRVGEVWRVAVTTAAGWRDERIVRFTGDAIHPSAVVVRRLSRGKGEHGQCDAVIAAGS